MRHLQVFKMQSSISNSRIPIMTISDWSSYAACNCPRCCISIEGIFPTSCPSCGLSTDSLANMGTTSFQKRKMNEHTDLLYGREIGFYGKEYNASYDYYGYANLQNLVRYAITYGARISIPNRNTYSNAILAYCPAILGTGTAMGQAEQVPCSGVCIVSPQSTDWGHSFPVIDDWVRSRYGMLSSNCVVCGASTPIGVPICERCYTASTNSWKEMIGL